MEGVVGFRVVLLRALHASHPELVPHAPLNLKLASAGAAHSAAAHGHGGDDGGDARVSVRHGR